MRRLLCILLLVVVATAAVAQDKVKPEPEALGDQALEVNVLGLVQFGPYARYHFQVADSMFLSPHIRVGYLGLLYLVFDWWAEIGVGTSYLTFWPTGVGRNHFYAGPVVELQILREDGNFLSGAGFFGNFGHRWYLPSGQFMQVGLLAGVSYSVVDEETLGFGMAELAWGFEI